MSAGLANRRVVDVLAELRNQGIVFIYNTQTISDELRIQTEPKANKGVQLAREILAEHGLELLPVAENSFAIVRRKQDLDDRTQSTATADTVALAEVVVQASRYSLSADGANARSVLTQTEVNNLPRLGDDTLRAVQRLPGAASNGWQSVGSIRGGVPNETGVFLDGLRLYEPFHLKNFLSPVSVLDARLVDSMEVYAGGFPVTFGDRMSAIIDARTVHPLADQYYELGLSAFHANGLASFAFADHAAHVLVTARRSNLSELAQFSEHDFGTPSYNDGFARLDYNFNPATRLALNTLFSHDEIDAHTDGGRQTTQAEYRNNYVWSTLTHDWSDAATSQALVGYTSIANNRYGQVADAPTRTADIVDLRTFQIANIRIDHSWRDTWFGKTLHQRAGAEARQLSGDYRYTSDVQFGSDYPFPGSPPIRTQRDIVVAPNGDELTVYWDARWDIASRWAIDAGLRFDDQSEYSSDHFGQWSPRIGVLFAPSPTLKLRASWGRFYQAQAINELQVEDGETNFGRPQHADHAIVSVEQELDRGFTWRIEAYRKSYRSLQRRFENLLDPLTLLPEVEYDRIAIAPSSARADGVELLMTVRPSGNWNGWLNYTWSRVRDRENGTDIVRSWDQTHAFNVGVVWHQGAWSFTAVDMYRTGWPTTALFVQGTSQVVYGPRNAERLNAFNSFDARAMRTFDLRHGELDVFLEATNIFDRGNECCVNYAATVGANGATVLNRSTDSWLGRIPSFGVLWRY
jgi:hypothetical protein